MIRTQVYLPEDLYKQLYLHAKTKNIPASRLIRAALRAGLKKSLGGDTPAAAFKRLAKIARKGPGDLTTRHDDYLYGGK